VLVELRQRLRGTSQVLLRAQFECPAEWQNSTHSCVAEITYSIDMATVTRFVVDPAVVSSVVRPTILCLSCDSTEQAEYTMVFCKAGWAISPVATVEHGAALLTSNRYSAVVVTGSVPLADQFAMATIARKEYGIPVLVVCNGLVEPNLPCDAVLPSTERHRLLSVLQKLTARAA
jgi:hypothetical protein